MKKEINKQEKSKTKATKKISTKLETNENKSNIKNNLEETVKLSEVGSKKKKLPSWAIITIIIISIFLVFQLIFVLVSFAFAFDNDNSFTVNNGIIEIYNGKLSITSDVAGFYDEKDNNYYIVGYLHNNSNKDYTDLNVNYFVYDIKGNVLGTATASLDYLKAKETWKFKAIYSNKDANEALTFKFSGISY